MLAVAWRRRLQPLAWIAVSVAMPTSVVILAKTGVVVPHAFFLIAFGVATLWMGYSLDWLLVRWPVALVADIVVVGVTMRALAPAAQESPGAALVVQVTLLAPIWPASRSGRWCAAATSSRSRSCRPRPRWSWASAAPSR